MIYSSIYAGEWNNDFANTIFTQQKNDYLLEEVTISDFEEFVDLSLKYRLRNEL